jgi:tRNA(Ile)-lysidine synthase
VRRPPAVARVLERVTATAREHEMFLPGQTVLVSVSGGPDSVCLVEALVRLRRLFKVRLEVFHFDHQIRSGSGRDADYVRRLAARLKLPFHLREARSKPARGESVEAWGRAQRRWYLGQVVRESGAQRIAIAHTLDDQAETVLLALVRGGGLGSLRGIAPAFGAWVNPLLDVRRREVEAFCRSLGLRPRDDPTNRDTRLLRNALRLRGLPALERATGRDLKETFSRAAHLLRQDEIVLSRLAAEAFDTVVTEGPQGVTLDAVGLLTLPRAIGARVVRSAIHRLPAMATEEAIDAALDLADGRPGRRRDLPHGLKAVREREYVLLSRPSPRN